MRPGASNGRVLCFSLRGWRFFEQGQRSAVELAVALDEHVQGARRTGQERDEVVLRLEGPTANGIDPISHLHPGRVCCRAVNDLRDDDRAWLSFVPAPGNADADGFAAGCDFEKERRFGAGTLNEQGC